jgi:CDK-activating kinase assembly factor MAT1
MTFIPQTFEDLAVEKEVAIRRKLAKESVAKVAIPFTILISFAEIRFNKRREDFPDLRSYNDYLQEVEDISKCINLTRLYRFQYAPQHLTS